MSRETNFGSEVDREWEAPVEGVEEKPVETKIGEDQEQELDPETEEVREDIETDSENGKE